MEATAVRILGRVSPEVLRERSAAGKDQDRQPWSPNREQSRIVETTKKLEELVQQRFTGQVVVGMYKGSINRDLQIWEVQRYGLPKTRIEYRDCPTPSETDGGQPKEKEK